MATLTIRNISDADIEQLKAFTGENTAAKALISAAMKAQLLKSQLDLTQSILEDTRGRLSMRNQLLEELTPLCTQVAELASQGDIFE